MAGKCTGLGIRVSGPEYRKMEHRETLKWGCCCKNVKTIMCQKGGTIPLNNDRLCIISVMFVTGVLIILRLHSERRPGDTVTCLVLVVYE